MNNYLKKVEEFQKTFKAPVLEEPSIIDEERFKLRVGLIQEELNELIEAHTNKDKVEVLDALADLQFVLSGIILELGYQNIFDEAFELVHESNMSKACISHEKLEETMASYMRQHVVVYGVYNEETNRYLVYRKSDNKILKNIDYNKVNLTHLVE